MRSMTRGGCRAGLWLSGPVAAVALVGCTAPATQPGASLSPSARSSTPVAAASQQLSLCQTGDTTVNVQQYAAGGFGVKVANRGPTCRLTGAALVEGFDRAGQRIAVLTSHQARRPSFILTKGATAVSWMTINDNHTSCKVPITRMSVRPRPGSSLATVNGVWYARPSAADPPYQCGQGSATAAHPYSIETTSWEKAPVEPSPGPGNG